MIGQLGSYGDCLYATTIARQIKADNPNCYLIWAIGTNYESILDGNPYVDQVMGIPIENKLEVKTEWFRFAEMARGLKQKGLIDELYLTQAYPGNPEKFHGCLRASMFRVYSNTTTVPLTPVLRLSQKEINRVKEFAEKNKLGEFKNVILFEWSPESNQSYITKKRADEIVAQVIAEVPGTCIIMSGNNRIKGATPQIIDGSYLSVRETAELTKYCTLLLGTGSGITQSCQTDWAKPLPTIQLLNEFTTASLKNDHEYFGLPTNQIIEVTSYDVGHIVYCVMDAIKNFAAAKMLYDETIKSDFNIIRFHMYFDTAMITGNYLDIIPAFLVTCKEYGLSIDLFRFFTTFPGSILTMFIRRINGVPQWKRSAH